MQSSHVQIQTFSPSQSQYSLDLSALGMDDSLNASSLLAQPKIDTVATSDIDGPSDFTVNMMDWMRGKPKKEATKNSARKSVSSKTASPPASPHSEVDGPSDFTLNMVEWMNGSKKATKKTSTVSPPASRPASCPVSRPASPHSKVDGPSDFTLNMVEWMNGTKSATKKTSPPASRPVSRPVSRPSSPTEIDGPSDFTLNMGQWMNGTKKATKTTTPRSVAPSNTSRPASRHPSPPVSRPVSRPASRPSSPSGFGGPSDFTINMGQWMGPSPKEPARKILTPRLATPKAPTPPSSSRLVSVEDTLIRHPSQKPQQFLQPTVEDCHSELLTPVRPASTALSPLLVTPTPPRRVSPPTTDATTALRAQLERALAANDLLRSELSAERQSRLRLEAELKASKARETAAVASASAARSQASAAEHDLESLRLNFMRQATAMATTHQEGMASLQATITAQATSHQEELETARAALASALASSAATTTRLETASQAQQQTLGDRLASAQTELGTTQEALASTAAALEAAKTELSAQADLNAHFDAQISARLRAREDRWKGKLEKLEEEKREWRAERAIMAKALLRQFGREECGVEEEEEEEEEGGRPQKYAYKY